jgi:tetratricopeptide (TPR) repeat protein
MTDPEKLIVYYSMILYLHKDYENALNLLNRYAKDIKGSVIYQANVQRILGLILQTKDDTVNEAMEAFQKAEKLYNQANSQYGKALSRYSMGLILQTKNALLNK